MRRFSHLFTLLLLLLFYSTGSFGQAWSGILAPGRAVDWSNAGLPGGVPDGSWSNCTTAACNTAYSSPTAANVSSACASAPANTVVRVPSGTYSLSASIHCNTSNVVLRGAGPTQTTITLNGNNILLGNGSGGQGSTPGGLGSTSLSTLTQGSTVLTVGSTSGMSVGEIVAITEQNTAWENPNGNEGNENATWCITPSVNFFGCSANSAAELVKITNVNAGANQITIDAPGLSLAYSSSLNPKVIYWNNSSVYSDDGVENMMIDAGTSSASDFAVALVFCNSCWIKNVAVVNAHRAGIYDFFGYRDEIRDSYVSASNSAGAPTEYGIEVDRSALTKIENNIEFGVTSPTVFESSYGIVESYNYMLRTPTDNVFPTMDTHRAHVYDVLYEGNVAANIDWDFVWGSASHNTAYRNRLIGNEPNATNYRTPVAADAYQRYMNIVGNVLGTIGLNTQYVCDSGLQLSNDTYVYDLGFLDGCVAGGLTGYDTVVESSMMRWGNWDAATYTASGSIHGTRWCAGSGTGSSGADAYNTGCTASETASSDPTFPGLANPSTTLPASFYLSAKPSWFGSVPFPAIGPDVTGGNIANTGGHANEIPAQVCYNNTAKNSSGFLTAFDANACYASNSSSTPPSPPASLAPPQIM